jgi:hypothetical protein
MRNCQSLLLCVYKLWRSVWLIPIFSGGFVGSGWLETLFIAPVHRLALLPEGAEPEDPSPEADRPDDWLSRDPVGWVSCYTALKLDHTFLHQFILVYETYGKKKPTQIRTRLLYSAVDIWAGPSATQGAYTHQGYPGVGDPDWRHCACVGIIVTGGATVFIIVIGQ